MSGSLLLVLPSVLSRTARGLEVDVDLAEGIRLYLESFDEVTVACPVTVNVLDSGLKRTLPVDELPSKHRVKYLPLPDGYNWRSFLSSYSQASSILKVAIAKSDHLIVSPHTLIGDWPTVAARHAISLGKPYVIEADVVYETVAKAGAGYNPSLSKRIKLHATNMIFRRLHRYCLKHSSLALFQGQDVYDAYAPFCRLPYKVYHMTISKKDHIADIELEEKLASVSAVRPMKLCYIGRAIEMKGPIDWLDTIREMINEGIKLHATWLGDGSLLPEMRSAAEAMGISAHVDLPGFVGDRHVIQKTLREADILLFCHKTKESARIFGEALASGCPIVGYGSAYPKELVEQHGGGVFVEVGDRRGLATAVRRLAQDPTVLRELIRSASLSGRLFDRDSLMQRRIDLIKQHAV